MVVMEISKKEVVNLFIELSFLTQIKCEERNGLIDLMLGFVEYKDEKDFGFWAGVKIVEYFEKKLGSRDGKKVDISESLLNVLKHLCNAMHKFHLAKDEELKAILKNLKS